MFGEAELSGSLRAAAAAAAGDGRGCRRARHHMHGTNELKEASDLSA